MGKLFVGGKQGCISKNKNKKPLHSHVTTLLSAFMTLDELLNLLET